MTIPLASPHSWDHSPWSHCQGRRDFCSDQEISNIFLPLICHQGWGREHLRQVRIGGGHASPVFLSYGWKVWEPRVPGDHKYRSPQGRVGGHRFQSFFSRDGPCSLHCCIDHAKGIPSVLQHAFELIVPHFPCHFFSADSRNSEKK